MHELKVARSQALTTREMAQIGLFTALIAAGAYIKINIPVQPFPMHFTMQFLFGVCGRWRSCLSDPSNIRIFTGLCICCLDHRKAVLPSPGSRYCLGSVQCLLGDDGLLCFRNGVFLWDQ